MKRVFAALFFLINVPFAAAAPAGPSLIPWQKWTDSVFQDATRAKKLILLDLEAVWCHWCHVMDAETYRNPEVAKLISEGFIPVKVDQDSRPDLANRYKEYGWPATIILNGKGVDLAKRAGFIEAENMISLLKQTRANPDKPFEDSAATLSAALPSKLPEKLRSELGRRYLETTDRKVGGLKIAQRFLDVDTIDRAVEFSVRGGEDDREIALPTLRANRKLIDPEWGGVYQYSTRFGWDSPHFEKIMSTQANNLKMYAFASRAFEDEGFDKDAFAIASYLNNFLRAPAGAWYTSQDADLVKGQHSEDYFSLPDKKRRLLGVPAIDTHIYSRENGWVIEALVAHHGFAGDETSLKNAIVAAEWILKNRALPGGGFRHDEKDAAGPYLGDSLGMSRAFLMLYAVTGDRRWLKHSQEAAKFVVDNFIEKENGAALPGFITAKPAPGSPLRPVRQIDENITAVRHLNLLSHYTGVAEFKNAAEGGMKYLAVDRVALDRVSEPGILSADEELASDPLHLTVIGGKGDAVAKELFVAAVRYPALYRRVEWWDRSEGPLPNPDVEYPELPKAAAFVCTNKRCSLPLFTAESLMKTIVSFRKQEG